MRGDGAPNIYKLKARYGKRDRFLPVGNWRGWTEDGAIADCLDSNPGKQWTEFLVGATCVNGEGEALYKVRRSQVEITEA
jgi:hypothetical protein